MEDDHEIISTVIPLPSAESCKKGCYPGSGVVLDVSIPDICTITYLLSVTSESMCTKYWVTGLLKLAQEKVWLGEMTVPP